MALRLVQDPDGFLEMALLKLDLVFERDPARRRKLQGLEQVLEDVEGMDWPAAARVPRPRPADLSLARSAVEFAAGDFPAHARARRPFLSAPRGSDPRATAS